MNRSMILENLHHIYKSLCFATGTMASNSYRERKPIDFTNKKNKIISRLWGLIFFKREFSRTYLCKLRTH